MFPGHRSSNRAYLHDVRHHRPQLSEGPTQNRRNGVWCAGGVFRGVWPGFLGATPPCDPPTMYPRVRAAVGCVSGGNHAPTRPNTRVHGWCHRAARGSGGCNDAARPRGSMYHLQGPTGRLQLWRHGPKTRDGAARWGRVPDRRGRGRTGAASHRLEICHLNRSSDLATRSSRGTGYQKVVSRAPLVKPRIPTST